MQRVGIIEPGKLARKAQPACQMSGLKPFEEQPPEKAREHVDGQEEVRPAGEPALALHERAAGNETVDMGMMGERLSPGMEDGEEADLATKVPWIRGNGLQRRGHRIEQDRIDDGFVVEGDLCRLRRHREHEVEVRHRQQIGLAICQPLITRCGLALRAMSVATGIIRGTAMAAVFAGLEMTAERRSPTKLDRRHDATLHAAEMAIVGKTISLTMAAEDIRHLQIGTH